MPTKRAKPLEARPQMIKANASGRASTSLSNRVNRGAMPPKDTKHDNFTRLAESRTSAVLEALRKLANLSSPNYEFHDAEVAKIFDAIEQGVEEARGRFKRNLTKSKAFRL